MENGAAASGASAAVFTNPRRLILLMGTPPSNELLRFLVHDFLDARPEIFQHDCGRISSWAAGYRSTGMGRRSRLIQTRDGHAMLHVSGHWTHRAGLRGARPSRVTTA